MRSPTKEIDRKEFHHRLQRIEVLVNAVEAAADPRVRGAATELLQTLMELHGAAVERMMDLVFESGPQGREIIGRIAADELAASVLLLHGLHPVDLDVRVVQALEEVGPLIHSRGGQVELLSLQEGVVRLRLSGSGYGSGTTAKSLQMMVEEAILTAAPDVTSIEVIPAPEGFGTGKLVQLGRAGGRNGIGINGR